MLDFNHGANRPAYSINATTLQINRLLNAGLERENATSQPRTYLGASQIGEPCLRKIQYGYQNSIGKGFDGKTLRIFRAGHLFEDMTAEELVLAGFDLRTKNADGFQFGFSVAGGRIKGHVDGVFHGGPPVLRYPALWEHKALGAKSWSEVVKNGVSTARPVYAAQIALYQAYMKLSETPALFTARNRDTQELYHEPVYFDAALAQRMSDRAVQILQASMAGELLPRCAEGPEFYLCRTCAFKERCWST